MSVQLHASDNHDERGVDVRFETSGLGRQTYAEEVGENVTNRLIDKFLLGKLCRSVGCTSASEPSPSIGMMADDPGILNSPAVPMEEE